MRSALPVLRRKFTAPVSLTPTVTRLARISPATKLRFDAVGSASSAGHTVTWLAVVGFTTVTFSTTADTPDAGTLPRPVTCNVRGVSPGEGCVRSCRCRCASP